MKNIFKNILLLFTATTLLVACDSENLTVLDPTASTTVSLSASDVVLDPINIGQDVLTVSWTAPDFGFSAGPTYMIEFSTADKSSSVSVISQLYKNFETEELNKILIGLGLRANVPTAISVTVKAVLSDTSEIISTETTLTATAYSTWIGPDYLFLVGDGTGAGWDNSNNSYPMFKDPDNVGLFVYTGYFKQGSVKALETKSFWQPQWGKGASDGVLAGNPGTQSGDPDVISVPADGYYTLKLDFSNNSYSLEAFDTSSSAVYTTIGVLGAATATGWDSDTDMTPSSFDPHFWTLSTLAMNKSDGGDCDCGFKFRADNDWATAWGGKENPPTLNYGIANTSGKNIGVPETGNYIIHFSDLDGRYSYQLIP